MIVNPFIHTLRYHPYNNTNKVDVNGRISDLGFNTSDGRVKVELINPDSYYYKQGVRKGYYVIAVIHHPVSTYADYLMTLGKVSKGTPYTLTFQSPEGYTIKVTRYKE